MILQHHEFEPPAESDGHSLWRYLDFPKFAAMICRKAIRFNLISIFEDKHELFISSSTFLRNELNRQTELSYQFRDQNPRPRPTGLDPLQDKIDLLNYEYKIKSKGADLVQQAAYEAEQLQIEKLREARELRDRICVSCWHCNQDDSPSMWSHYGDRGVAVITTYQRLVECLDKRQQDKWFYVGRAKYQEPINIPDDVAIALYKRPGFVHEKELRAWAAKRASIGM